MVRFKNIARICLVASCTLVFAAPSYADFNVKNYQFAPDAYKDLPGVKDPKDLATMKDSYRCETVLLQTRNPEGRYRDVFGSRGLPRTGYKCTSADGYVYYGTVHPKARNNQPQVEPHSPL